MTRLATVEKNTLIRKDRRLPAKGEVLVSLGDIVKMDTPIARGRVRNPDVVEVRVDQKLGVDPYNLSGYMLKREGDAVKKDEVIALRRSFFGSSTKVCRSPLSGTLEVFSKSTGRVLIRGEPLQIEVKAHIPGRVAEIFPLEGAAVECRGSLIRGAIGLGGETHGIVDVPTSGPGDTLTDAQITKNQTGRVVVGGSIVTLEALKKAAVVDVAAVVVGGVDEKDLTDFLGHEIGFGVTGQEKTAFTLVITGGFGDTPMDEGVFGLLRENEGVTACVDGATQIRTRMLRPEIILPTDRV